MIRTAHTRAHLFALAACETLLRDARLAGEPLDKDAVYTATYMRHLRVIAREEQQEDES